MGGNSTLQSASLGDQKTNVSSDFDLHSWQGLTLVLKQGKESMKDPAEYAEFRNLVLEYAQQGGDVELRKQIDTTIATFDNKNVEKKIDVISESSKEYKKETYKKQTDKKDDSDLKDVSNIGKKPTGSFGTRRVQPSFKSTPQAAEVPIEVKEKPVQESTTDIPVENKIEEVATNTAETPVSEQVSAPAEPQVQVPTPEPQVASEQTNENIKSVEEHKKRIAEIKRIVHEEIGNPASIISSYNEKGKQYMTALLSALKAVGPGSTESPNAAMQRLEDAFDALMTTPVDDEKEKKISEPNSQPAPQVSRSEKVTEEVPVNIPVAQPEKVDKVKETPTPTPQAPVQQPEKELVAKENSKPQPLDNKDPAKVPDPVQDKADPKKVIAEEKVEKGTKKDVPTQASKQNAEPQTLPKIKSRPTVNQNIDTEESEVKEEKKSRLSPISTLASLLVNEDIEEKPKNDSEKSFHEIPSEKMAAEIHSDIKKAKDEAPPVPKPAETGYTPVDAVDATKIAMKQTELSSPKVTQALYQLLEEWSIFKSSGFFGIGPTGQEHPLYQTLAPLSMGEVVSGRWEGSDRKVAKTIKEYVDAWRHEQGIAYNIQETFEHYLRRVVLRIQQRQEESK